jgi:surface polysaccharide O-acyltransferase-like enzyme
MATNKSTNLDWVNSLKLISLFAVIVLHTAAIPLAQYGQIPVNTWLVADLYNGLTRFAVPVFVMITGSLLLHREYKLGDFLKKRLSRIFTPFLFWSLVYIAYSWYNEELMFSNTDAWANIRMVLHLLKDGASYHLWYVYMLIGLYFFIPVIGKFVRNASRREIEYFLIVWLVVMFLAQPYLLRFNPQFDMHYFIGYAGYLVLGHYLSFNVTGHKYLGTAMFVLFLAMLTLIVVGTCLLYKAQHNQTLLYEPLNPAIVLLASSIFLMVRFSKLRVTGFAASLRDLASRYNFGIYLSHALILYLLDDILGINYSFCNPAIAIPATAISCFVLSLLLVWLLDKIPFIGKWIAG